MDYDKVGERDIPLEEQNPEIAADSHKLEKEWVAQTEKIIKENAHDPRELEIKIEKLKADYMKKRFNRAIGDHN